MLAPSKRLAQLVFACALGGYAIVAACGGSDSGPSSTSHEADAGPDTPTVIIGAGGSGPSIVGIDNSRHVPLLTCKGLVAPPIDAASVSDAVVDDSESPADAEAGSEEAGSVAGADAGREASNDAGECPLPASVCFDDQWLTYFTGGACVGGVCQWDAKFMLCSGFCYGGQCGQVMPK